MHILRVQHVSRHIAHTTTMHPLSESMIVQAGPLTAQSYPIQHAAILSQCLLCTMCCGLTGEHSIMVQHDNMPWYSVGLLGSAPALWLVQIQMGPRYLIEAGNRTLGISGTAAINIPPSLPSAQSQSASNAHLNPPPEFPGEPTHTYSLLVHT